MSPLGDERDAHTRRRVDRRLSIPQSISTSTSTSASTIEPFPTLTRSQHARLDRIINALPSDASTWADFKRRKEQLEGETSTEDDDDDNDNDEQGRDDDIYAISLKLVLQPGVTWQDKWRRVHQPASSPVVPVPTPSRTPRLVKSEVLQARIAQVKPYESEPEPSHVNPPSTRPVTASRRRSIPVVLGPETPSKATQRSARPHTPVRDLLVRKTEPGHSSSDDYAGVPSLQDLALARRRNRDRELQRQHTGLSEPESRPQVTTSDPAPTRDRFLPSQSVPFQSTPPRPSKHPLLERRLAELGIPAPASPSLAPTLPVPLTRASLDRAPSRASTLERLEAQADRFNRARLESTHFDAWRTLTRFEQSRFESVVDARTTWLKRCALRDWISASSRSRERSRREEWWHEQNAARESRRDQVRTIGAWRMWRDRFQVKINKKRQEEEDLRKQQRELDLKAAKNQTVHMRDKRLLRQALESWRLKTLESVAFRFRLQHLPLHPIRKWRQALVHRQIHVETLESVADEVWTGSEHKRVERAFGHWRKKTRLSIAETAVETRLYQGIQHGVMTIWLDKTRHAIHLRHLQDLAQQSDARRLASRAFATWKSRLDRVTAHSEQASAFDATLAIRLGQRSLRTWSLSTLARRFYQKRTTSLAHRHLSKWVERLDHLEIDLESLSNEMIKTRNLKLATVSFEGWRAAINHRTRLAQAADAVYRDKVLARSLKGWHARIEHLELDQRKALVVREFFVQRGAWRIWFDKMQACKQDKWIENRIRLRKQQAFDFWVARTRQSQQDKRSIALVQQKNRKLTLQDRLATWKEQVIVRKELERESTILYESRLVDSSFKRWIIQTVSHADQLARADQFRALKAEELRDATFHRWLVSTRNCLALKERFASHVKMRRRKTLEDAFERWRERRLRRLEVQVRDRVESNTRQAVLVRWQAETQTLTALRVHRKNLLQRTFSSWKRWTPSVDLRLQAVEHDGRTLMRCTVQRWSLKTSYRQAFRNTSGRLSMPRSIPSSSPSSAPRAGSPVDRPMSPFPPSTDTGLSLETLTLSPLSSPIGNPAHSLPRSNSNSAIATSVSLSSPRQVLVRTTIPAPSPVGAFRRRPRLSAEYVAPLPPLTRRRRSSIASLGARSAPAPTAPSESGTETEDEYRSMFSRKTARSEGGEAEPRDVRKSYEALRERLRAAATISTRS
ncbi:Sfi1p [Sporobolomyces koalae]|uniref:Sfi1p n=1 Tax=Sporobolomyces koalae TaxID=500713 RepID=UPI00316C7155